MKSNAVIPGDARRHNFQSSKNKLAYVRVEIPSIAWYTGDYEKDG